MIFSWNMDHYPPLPSKMAIDNPCSHWGLWLRGHQWKEWLIFIFRDAFQWPRKGDFSIDQCHCSLWTNRMKTLDVSVACQDIFQSYCHTDLFDCRVWASFFCPKALSTDVWWCLWCRPFWTNFLLVVCWMIPLRKNKLVKSVQSHTPSSTGWWFGT